ncbi:hypothetical protein EV363DRAFT_1172185, partial [Boletus edulis]
HATLSYYQRIHRRIALLDLALPKPVSNTDVLPISIRSQHLFESSWEFERHTVSDDGYVQGLFLTEQPTGPLAHFGFMNVRKFTIDASREECAIAVSDPCPLDLPVECEDIAFDGIRVTLTMTILLLLAHGHCPLAIRARHVKRLY